MSKHDSSIGDCRSDLIVLEDPDLPVRGVLDNNPSHFFGDDFDVKVGYEACDRAKSKPRAVSQLRDVLDPEMLVLILFIGVPILAYSALSG